MQQIQSTLSAKHQTVIPSHIRKALKLKAGDKIMWRVVITPSQPVVIAEPLPKNWAFYMRGLGKYIWQNINIQTYIQNLRQEWENKT